MTKKYTTCKTVIKQGKRRLEYVNHRSKTRLPIKVGKKGGLSVKPRNSKNRRYIKSVCKKTHCDGKFWQTVESIKKSKSKSKK